MDPLTRPAGRDEPAPDPDTTENAKASFLASTHELERLDGRAWLALLEGDVIFGESPAVAGWVRWVIGSLWKCTEPLIEGYAEHFGLPEGATHADAIRLLAAALPPGLVTTAG